MKHRNEKLIIAAILAVSVMQMGANGISPILADLAEAFPQASDSVIQFLMTFPGLMVIVFGLIAGVASQYVPKKWLSVAGSALFVLGGVLAWLFHGSLAILYVWAAMIGAGIGLAVPVNMGMVTELLAPEHQATVMGWSSGVAHIGSMLMTFVGGYLALIHWSYGYLVYLIAVPAVILSLIAYPNTISTGEKKEEAPAEGKKKVGILTLIKQPALLATGLTAFCSSLLFNTTPSNLSMQVAELGVGTSAQAGTGVSLMLLSGAISCMFYGKLSKKIGNYILTLDFVMMGIGQLICALAPNIWMIYLGCLIAGCSHGNNMAHCLMLGSKYAMGNSSLSASIVTSLSNLGAFCAPVLTMLAALISGGSAIAPRFRLSGCLALIVALVIAISCSRQHGKANRAAQA